VITHRDRNVRANRRWRCVQPDGNDHPAAHWPGVARVLAEGARFSIPASPLIPGRSLPAAGILAGATANPAAPGPRPRTAADDLASPRQHRQRGLEQQLSGDTETRLTCLSCSRYVIDARFRRSAHCRRLRCRPDGHRIEGTQDGSFGTRCGMWPRSASSQLPAACRPGGRRSWPASRPASRRAASCTPGPFSRARTWLLHNVGPEAPYASWACQPAPATFAGYAQAYFQPASLRFFSHTPNTPNCATQ